MDPLRPDSEGSLDDEEHGKRAFLRSFLAQSLEEVDSGSTNPSPSHGTYPTVPERPEILNHFAVLCIQRYEQGGGPAFLDEAIKLLQEARPLFPPDHPNRPGCLNNIVNAILKRYKQDGRQSDLLDAIQLQKEALDLQPAGHPERPGSLDNLTDAILARYQRDSEISDLSSAIELQREALDIRLPGHPDRSISLHNLACGVLMRYQRDNQEPDLGEAIELQREALGLLRPDHPNWANALSNLACSHFMRYQRSGEKSDLPEAIKLHKEALILRPPGHPYHSSSVSNLAIAILMLYELDGGRSNLSEAIELLREALCLRPLGHPERPASLGNLAKTTLTLYELDGGQSNLSEAIELYREALSLRPSGHHDRPSTLSNLANAILKRCERDGAQDDLSEVIELHKEALILQPPGHSDRSGCLGNLASALLARYRLDNGPSDLSKAIQLYEEALNLIPHGHPDRSHLLKNLAGAVLIRYQLDGAQSDILEVIDLQTKALNLRPPGHPYRSNSLDHLALAYHHKFQKSGDTSDLQVALEYQRVAFDTQPAEHPLWSMIAFRLAGYMFEMYEISGPSAEGDGIIEQIVHLLRDATVAQTSPILHRLYAAVRWVDIAVELDSPSALEAYRAAFNLLGSAITLSRTLQSMHGSMLSDIGVQQPAKSFALKAARWALASGVADSKLAVEFLDRGRNVLLGSVGQFRVDLSEVRRRDSALADDFQRSSRLLESAIMTGQDISEKEPSYEDPANRFARISADWQAIINKIRSLSGCEAFLLPVPYLLLQEAAVGGPVIIVVVDEKRSTAIIVTFDGEPRTIDLPEASEGKLKTLYTELEEAVAAAMRGDTRRADKKLTSVLSELWRVLAGPIIYDLIEGLHTPLHSRIWWYPTSWASFLPLHAAGSYKKGGSNVPDLFVSSYTPTLQALIQARGRVAASSGSTLGPLIVAQAQTPGQPELFCVEQEAEIVRCLAQNTFLLSGERGTRENVLAELRNHSWIHLACHGLPNPSDPFKSNFALHDGPLSLQDIIMNNLPSAEFAYLSACHSAAQDRTLPDEGLTLAGGMQFAGFKSVVGTLWAMADEDAPTLAKVFYERLGERSGDNFDYTKTAESLHDAVKELRKQKVPLFRWINLVHYGI